MASDSLQLAAADVGRKSLEERTADAETRHVEARGLCSRLD